MRLSWLDLKTLVRLTGGVWFNAPEVEWRPQRLCFQGRWKPQSLIIPLGQPFRHGVDVAGVDRGGLASCVMLVSKRMDEKPGLHQLVVPSIDSAVESIAAASRSRYAGTICAVTGSVGKSSTCRLLTHVLSKHERCNQHLPGANTKAGAIAQIINLHDERFAVIEMSVGSGLPRASQVVQPHVAIITAIAPAHLTYAGPLARLAQLKASIFSGLDPKGVAIINCCIPHFDKVHAIAKKYANTVVTYGDHAEADVRLLDYDRSRRLVAAEIQGNRITYELGIEGRHMAVNSLAALSALSVLGLDYREGSSALAEVRNLARRDERYAVSIGGQKVTLIDDSNNANPASMRAAIELLADLQPAKRGRRVVVLADMLELGSDEVYYHRELVDPILEARIDKVHTAGPLMAHLWDELPCQYRGAKCDSTEELLEAFLADISEGDVVLFKGSHAHRLWTLVKKIRELDDNFRGPTATEPILSSEEAIVILH